MAWTLQYGSTTKAFHEWGMINVRREVDGRGGDVFGFNVRDALYDAAAAFPDGAEITIRRDAVVWFVGRRIRNPRLCRPEMEGLAYVFAGPWWYMEHLVFQQIWKSYDAGVGGLVDKPSSKVFLGQKILLGTVEFQNTADQILEIIEWCRARQIAEFGAAKFHPGGGFPSVEAPIDEAQDITCAEAMAAELRWHPDAVIWFDYSTSPPTLHCKRRSALSAVTRALVDAEKHESIQIESCDELVVPVVHFKYRITSTIDGEPREVVLDDIAPSGATGLEFNVMVGTFELDGGSRTTQTATIVTEPAGGGSTWWRKNHPQLNEKTITNLTFVPDTSTLINEDGGSTAFGQELVEGTIPDWAGEDSANLVATAEVTYELWDRDVTGGTSGANSLGPKREVLTKRYKATNALSQTFVKTTSVAGDVIPSGLAAAVHASVSQLHFKGQVSFVEQEISDLVKVGQKLNLSGGRAEWATMNALVQSVVYDIDEGRTTATFGPAPFQSPGDLIQLLQVNRRRNVRTSYSRRLGVSGGGAGDVELGKTMPRASAVPAVKARSMERFIPNLGDMTSLPSFLNIGTSVANGPIIDAFHGTPGGPRRQLLSTVTASATTVTISFVNALNQESKVVISAEGDDVRMRMTSAVPGMGSVDLKLSEALGHEVKLREQNVCVDGVLKNWVVLSSEFIDLP